MYFIDVQGTLISDYDKSPIKGSREFIDKLNAQKIPYMIITNNTKNSSENFLQFLQNSGFNISMKNYLDPLMVLNKSVKKQKIAAYGTEDFLSLLQKFGYELDYKSPDIVLIAIKKDFHFDEYSQIIEFLLSGASLIGMHETSLYAKENKRYPGVGAILKMLQFATQKNYTVIGKPSETFYNQAIKKLRQQNAHAKFTDITIISDDPLGDLVGAKKLGMHTIFVTSGKFKNAQEIIPHIPKELQPECIYTTISELV